MQKIVFDCERMKYPNTGLNTFCELLAKSLLAQKKTSQELILYIPKSRKNLFKNVKIIFQKSWHKIYIPLFQPIDIWHCTYQNSKYFPSKKSIKKVLTIHDLNFLIEKMGQEKKINRYLMLLQKQIDKSDAIITISEFVKQEVLQYFDLKGKEISVIYNGGLPKKMPKPKVPKQALANKDFIFSIGTILPKKNFHVLPSLLKNRDLQLVIAGNFSSKTYLEQIKKEAEKHNVSSQITFTGPISDAEKHWYYQHCKAFVFPSLAEGFGIPIIEALHYGKPVFSSKATCLPEIGADATFYFESFEEKDMNQTFDTAMSHFDTKQALAGKERAAQFTWERTAQQYLDVYQSLI